MSEQVVIRSTQNGPNLVIVDGKAVNAWLRRGGSDMMPFCDGSFKVNCFKARAHEVKAQLVYGLALSRY